MLGWHITFGAYGFWLPNDPRGSGSTIVWAPHLLEYGPATGIEERSQSRAGIPHDPARRRAAKRALSRPPVRFTGVQALAVARGFARIARENAPAVWACCVLPTHVHLVTSPAPEPWSRTVSRFKVGATQRLIHEGIHPFQTLATPTSTPKCWQRGGWTVFLDTPADVERSIKYVRENPLKEGKPEQKWWFVEPFVYRI